MNSTFKILQNMQQGLWPASKKSARRALSLALALALVISLGGMAPLAESEAPQGGVPPLTESDAGQGGLPGESDIAQDGLPLGEAPDQPDQSNPGQAAQEVAPADQMDASQTDPAACEADLVAPAGQPDASPADPDAPADQMDASQTDPVACEAGLVAPAGQPDASPADPDASQADPAIDGSAQEGAPMHAHAESCIAERPVLVCIEEHEHTDGCYQMQSALVCGLEEAAPEQPGIQQPGTQEIAPLSAPAPVLPRGPRSAGELYTVTFYDGTQTGDPSSGFYHQVPVLEGDTCPVPGTPQIPPGYSRFIGWFVDGADAPFDFMAPVMADIALHARYTNADDVQVTFQNGQNVAIGYVPLASGSLLSQPGEAITGGVRAVGRQIFIGKWYDKQIGSPSGPFFDFAALVTEDVVLAPAFIDGFFVHYYTGGSPVPSELALPGAAISEPAAAPIRPGFSFTGWSESYDGTTGLFDFAASRVNSDIMLCAQWTGVAVGYSVAYWFEKPGGAVDDMLTDGQKNDPSNYAYAFTVTKAGSAGSIVSVDSSEAAADVAGTDLELYGQHWRSTRQTIAGNGSTVINVYFIRNIYTFIYNLNLPGGYNADTYYVKFTVPERGITLRSDETPTFTERAKWQGVGSLTGLNSIGGSYSTTLWNKITGEEVPSSTMINLTFGENVAGDASDGAAVISVIQGRSVILPAAEALGFDNPEGIFLGWSADPDAAAPGNSMMAGNEKVFNLDADLYAVWKWLPRPLANPAKQVWDNAVGAYADSLWASAGETLKYRVSFQLPIVTRGYRSLEIQDLLPASLVPANGVTSVRVFADGVEITERGALAKKHPYHGGGVISFVLDGATDFGALAGAAISMELETVTADPAFAGTILNRGRILVNDGESGEPPTLPDAALAGASREAAGPEVVVDMR